MSFAFLLFYYKLNCLLLYLLFVETILHLHRVAFAFTQYPLIILLEVSCGLPQQKRAAKLLRKVFGDAIYTPSEVQSLLLPSPNTLRNRVIIFLTHRKKDIHTAYRVSHAYERVNTAATITTKLSMQSMGLDDSFSSRPQAEFLSPDNSDLLDDLGEAVQEVGDEEVEFSYSDEEMYGMNAPLSTVQGNNKFSTRGGISTAYAMVDPEASRRDGSLDQSQIDLLHNCQAVHSTLMRLCHYSKGLRIGSHGLGEMLARITEYPSAEEALVRFNGKRFW
jgi:hypothetical protein